MAMLDHPALSPLASLNLSHLTPLNALLGVLAYLAVKITYGAIYNIYFHPLRAIPGPNKYAEATVLWKFWRMLVKGDRFHVLHDALEAKGGIIRTAPSEVILKDPKWTKKVLMGKLDRDSIFNTTTFHGSQNLISLTDYATGTARRKVVLPQYSTANLIAFEDAMTGPEIDKAIQYLHDKEGEPAEMMILISHLIIDIIGEILLDGDLKCMETLMKGEVDPVIASMQVLAYAFNAERSMPQWLFRASAKLLPFKTWKTIVGAANVMTACIKSFTERALEKGVKEERMPLVHRLVRDAEKFEGKPMSMPEIFSEAGIQFFAGMETTAIALTYVFWLFTSHPHIMRKLRDEVLKADEESGRGLDIATVMRLPYLNAVIKETMRIYPPAPTARTKVVGEEGMQIDEHFLPPGTLVGLQIWTMHRSESIWGPDAAEFRPERWLEAMTEEQTAAYQPFSMGGRNCVGMNLANIDMRLIVAHVVKSFDVTCDSKTTPETMKPIDTESLKPAAGECWLRFTPRAETA